MTPATPVEQALVAMVASLSKRIEELETKPLLLDKPIETPKKGVMSWLTK